MKRTVLTAYMPSDTDPAGEVEETVTVLLGDQMRAELELGKRGQSPTTHGISFVAAMAWAALAREGRTTLAFPEFAAQCFDVARQSDEDAPDVDPTRPAVSTDSVSSSPSSSPAPVPTGGEPASPPATTV
jgi:hypothetical protein